MEVLRVREPWLSSQAPYRVETSSKSAARNHLVPLGRRENDLQEGLGPKTGNFVGVANR